MLGQPRCPLGKHPRPFFFSLQMGIVVATVVVAEERGVAALCPLLITEDNTKSRKKRAKRRDKRYPRRRIRFNFTSFLLPAMFHFLPARVIALPTRREVGMQRRGRMEGGRCAGDVPFCFLICMGVSAEWQISGEPHAGSLQKVAASQEP